MSELKNSAIAATLGALVQQIVYYFPCRAALFVAIAFAAVTLAGGTGRELDAQAVTKDGAIMVRTEPDESSPLVETVRDGETLSPIAETTSAGIKWFFGEDEQREHGLDQGR